MFWKLIRVVCAQFYVPFPVQVNVHFSASSSGVMELLKAEAVVELPEPPAPKKNDTAAVNATGSANATESNTTDAEPGEGEGEAKPAESNAEEEPAKTETGADAQKDDKESNGTI